jgi:AmmeMemoRadiSam system protein A
MNPSLKLAKDTIETYLKKGVIISPPANLPKEMLTKKAGVFVSIHQKDGSLRGCIGTFLPTQKSIAYEIIKNALAAAFNDPRFPPITLKELPNLDFSIDLLSKPKKAALKDLNPKKYGLIVSTKDGRKGLLLPDIPSIKTPEEQIQICRQKAGIGPNEKISLHTFTVKRYKEK